MRIFFDFTARKYKLKNKHQVLPYTTKRGFILSLQFIAVVMISQIKS